jgi:hypothetical protein
LKKFIMVNMAKTGRGTGLLARERLVKGSSSLWTQ